MAMIMGVSSFFCNMTYLALDEGIGLWENGSMKKRYLLFLLIALLLFPIAAKSSESFEKLSAPDTKGNSVTGEIFSSYDLTMVNVFTTWCKYCIEEMPELIEMKKELPPNVNLISICLDAYTATKSLELIEESFPFNFPILKMTSVQLKPIHPASSFPTSFFVDRSGKIVSVVSGMPRDGRKGYLGVIHQLLEGKR